ncbi:MAG TPA: SGNH/GDSL hydrolase family protein [Vicinamibacteria bacterium]
MERHEALPADPPVGAALLSGPRTLLPLAAAAALAGCGGSSPGGPGPVPTPVPGNTVVAIAFYDENANGRAEPGEPIRVPDVELAVSGRTARTEKLTGRATITGVPAGQHAVAVRTDTLPPFFTVGAPVSASSPQEAGAPALIPLVLPIGRNRPNVYMAFGDSITRQDGVALSALYPPQLQAMLAAHFAGAEVVNRGNDGTNTWEGAERIGRGLDAILPAYSLILYGTNDWHDPVCQDTPPCHVVDNLRRMVDEVKAAGSLPFVATLPPVNPALNPAGRNDWIRAINDAIRAMAREEGAFLVDMHAAFTRQPSLPALFDDHVHPSEAGRRLVAETFFEAIAHGRSGAN